VLGGDLVRSDKYLVDVCVLGVAERPVRRSGARPGDGVWVTGTLGGAAVALREWLAGRRPEGDLATRYARPEPRIAAGRWLATQGATAMIDVSDGLSGDAGHLAAASGVQIEIALERVPCWVGVEPLLAVASGEEFELLVTLPPAFGEAEARAFTNANHLPLTRIGRCAAGVPSVRFADRGVPVSAPHGFDHFAR
jgi:thiamine-monophosphate kinase